MSIAKKQVIAVFLALVLSFSSISAFSFSLNIFHLFQKKEKHVKRRPSPAYDNATHIKVGVYMLHVGKYDLQSASTQADFYLIFHCTPLCNRLNFEIMNATSSSIHLVNKQKDSLVYRVQANLSKTDSLRNYPFDSHSIDVVLEDRQLTRDKVVFQADPATTGMDEDLTVVGYHLLPHWTASVTNHYYKVFDRTFSSYKFSIFIKRPWLAGVLKGILPALIVICCSFLALFMKIEHVSQRFGIATSTLITMAVFHLTLTSSLPPLGYVTYADTFMLINYLCLFSVLIEVVAATHFIDSTHKEFAVRFNRYCAWLIPIIWFVLQIITWIAFNPLQVVTS